jgi:hypothetical protein
MSIICTRDARRSKFYGIGALQGRLISHRKTIGASSGSCAVSECRRS